MDRVNGIAAARLAARSNEPWQNTSARMCRTFAPLVSCECVCGRARCRVYHVLVATHSRDQEVVFVSIVERSCEEGGGKE